MPTHYIDFEILGAPSDEAFLRNKVFNVLHGVLNRHCAGKIGLSFPDYKDDTLGKRIRVFGANNDLNLLSHESNLIKLAECNAVRMGIITSVPKLTGVARFVRDRTMEKQKSTGYLARCQRRRQKRGTDGNPVLSAQVIENAKSIQFPYLKLQSGSNSFTFSLYIRKEAAIEAQLGDYSGYGLSKEGSTVPWF